MADRKNIENIENISWNKIMYQLFITDLDNQFVLFLIVPQFVNWSILKVPKFISLTTHCACLIKIAPNIFKSHTLKKSSVSQC